MDEHEADQLWRELNDTDRAAKRGYGVGFGNASTGADPLETSNPPAGLSATFRKATDVESKEMAQEQLSARDRIRARIKSALQDKKATQQHEDSQWENFLTQKKRERVGLESIVDDQGRMLGCTYNYTDSDHADLDNAMSRATAARAAGKSAAEVDHAAAIFGGGDSNGRGQRRSDAAGGTASHQSRRHRKSPSRNRSRDASEMYTVPERYGYEDRSARYRDQAETSKYPERRRPGEEYARRGSARGDGQYDTHREAADRRGARDRYTDRGSSRRSRDGDAQHGRDHSRSITEGSPPTTRDLYRDRQRRQQSGGREERGVRDRDGGVREDSVRDDRRRESGRQNRCNDAQGGPREPARGRLRAGEVDGRVGERQVVRGAAAGDRGAAARAGAASARGAGQPEGFAGRGDATQAQRWPSGGGAGDDTGAGLGSCVLNGVVPEGAVVVEECEINRREPEVEAHDALDASVVVKARGSWREQLKRRMEGVL